MSGTLGQEKRPYPGGFDTARTEAIKGIGEYIFSGIEPDASSEGFEATIGPDEVIHMVQAVVTSLEAQGALRNRVNLVEADIPQVVDDIIAVLRNRNLVEDN